MCVSKIEITSAIWVCINLAWIKRFSDFLGDLVVFDHGNLVHRAVLSISVVLNVLGWVWAGLCNSDVPRLLRHSVLNNGQ